MPHPPEAPHDPASDATSRIGDILAAAEREVADIIAAAERRSAAEHDSRTRQLDARSTRLDERDATLARRDAEQAEQAARLAARAARLQARAAELEEITSGLLSSTLGVQDHAARLQELPDLDDEDEAGPSSGGSPGYEPVTPPTALRRRSFGPVPTSAPDGLASEHEAPVASADPARPELLATGSTPSDGGDGAVGEAAAEGTSAPGDRAGTNGSTPVIAAEPGDIGLAESSPGSNGTAAVGSNGASAAGPAAHDAPSSADDGAVPDGVAADGEAAEDSPDKVDSARLVALSMAAEGRPRDDVEAYLRDELKIADHASIIDYVFGISTPSSVVPSWPPRRRRRPS